MVQADERYLEHFGLAKPPFGPAPDPEFVLLVAGASHGACGARFRAGLGRAGDRADRRGRQRQDHVAGAFPRLGSMPGSRRGWSPRRARVATSCPPLRCLRPPGARGRPVRGARRVLQAEARAERRLLAVVDEAQNLSPAALEDLRLMGNLSAEGRAGHAASAGRPAAASAHAIRAPELSPFAQRVAVGRHLGGFDLDEVGGYIAARLQAAGGEPRIFSRQAAEIVHRATGGLPRLVNQLCDLALTYAAAAEAPEVRRATVIEVLRDGIFFAHHPDGIRDAP
jgi:general secretion pathway protein A